MDRPRIIYDFGANNGDDLHYYLRKADRVVAVEANPVLCAEIGNRFRDEIDSGRLIVEDKVLATTGAPSEVYFYLHKTNSVLSRFPEPENPESFDKILLPSCSPVELIARHGEPYYIKIDIEFYDAPILREFLAAGIRPPFLSAEAHTLEVFAVLMGMGGYGAFKLVDGRSVPSVYGNATIETSEGLESYSFPYHSAGPFGDDVVGPWLDGASLAEVLVLEGCGWKDIHASNIREPEAWTPSTWRLARRLLRKAGRDLRRKVIS